MGRKKEKFQSKGISEKFLERLTEMFGVSLFNEINSTFAERRPTTFRVNTIKAKKMEILDYLNQNDYKVENVPWYKDAFILLNKSKRDLVDSEIYTTGKIYVQSLASMVPVLVLDPKPGDKVLDLTAAPGSKTSQIAALMNKEGELLANDSNKIRFFKLKHNMEMLGVADGDFLNLRMEYGSVIGEEYPEYFDKVLLDAPCSAEARFVSNEPKSYGYWKESKVKEMAFKQRKLLFSAWNALKPGGILVYSTCTFAPEENELQISKFLEQNDNCELLDSSLAELKRLPIVKKWKNKEIDKEVVDKGFRIMPTKEIEGFFVTKLRKAILSS